MKLIRKEVLAPILVVVFTLIFAILDVGTDIDQVNQIFKPTIFAICFIISIFYPFTRRYILTVSSILLLSMIFTYLFNMLEVSNWLGSLGFGMLFLTVISYTPQFLKKGCIEKF